MKLTIQSAKQLTFDLTLCFSKSLKILLFRRDCFAGGMYLFGVRTGCLSFSGTGVSSKSITPPPVDSSNQICFSQFIVSYHFFLVCNISQFTNSFTFLIVRSYIYTHILSL